MNTSESKTIMSKLNNEQKKAVKSVKGPVRIIAGPGSGKTKIMISKMIYLIHHYHIPAKNILAITFTNSATDETKNRLERILGRDATHVHIKTFHSLALSILRKCHSFKSFRIINTNMDAQYNALQDAIDRVEHRHVELGKVMIKNYLKRISKDENELILPHDLKNASNRELKTFSKVYLQYLKNLKSHGLFDFGSIIILAIKVLKRNSSLLKGLQNEFKYVLVDEYQDTSHAQAKLIYLISGKYNNLTVVGDANQSIFGFMGTSPDNILNFGNNYDFGAKSISMKQNYRSTPSIVHVANETIKPNPRGSNSLIYTNNRETNNGYVVYIRARTAQDEARAIGLTIKQKHYVTGSKNNATSSCAILCRQKRQLPIIANALKRFNIPHYFAVKDDIYKYKDMQGIISYLFSLDNPNNVYSIEEIINYPRRGIGKKSCEKLFNEARTLKKSVTNSHVLNRLYALKLVSKSTANHIKKFDNLFKSLRDFSKTHSITSLIKCILSVTNYKKETNVSKNRLKYLLKQAKEFDISNINGNLGQFLDYLATNNSFSNMSKGNGVPLMTIHASKGHEFDNEFIAGLNEGWFPSNRDRSNRKSLYESRRLMYVGITRARKRLYLTSADVMHVNGVNKRMQPSQFINEIDNHTDYRDFRKFYYNGRTFKIDRF